MVLSACSDKYDKYAYENIGLFDSETKGYINIGDNKSYTEIVFPNVHDASDELGCIATGFPKDADLEAGYVEVRYDENDTIYEIVLIGYDDEKNRYKLQDETEIGSPITDIIRKYQPVYAVNNKDIIMFIKENNKQLFVMSIEEFKEVLKEYKDNNNDLTKSKYGKENFYSIEYFTSKSEVSCIRLRKQFVNSNQMSFFDNIEDYKLLEK